MYGFDDIRDDGTVKGRVVETHYLQAKHIGLHVKTGGVYLRVVMDDNGSEAETRVLLTSVMDLLMESAATPNH